MKQPAKYSCQAGLLLVEAVLSAVVITVGLVCITQGLTSQLKALRMLEARETLLALARWKLTELETSLLSGRPLPPDLQDDFAEPYQSYQWSLIFNARADLIDKDGSSLASDVSLTVTHAQPPIGSVTLGAVWLKSWLPQA